MSDDAKPMRRRRTPRSVEEIKRLLAAYEQGEVSAKRFCAAHNIGASTLQKWKSRHGKKDDVPSAQDGFITLEVPPVVAPGYVAGLFAEVNGIRFYQACKIGYH